jgi:hypothetical protein
MIHRVHALLLALALCAGATAADAPKKTPVNAKAVEAFNKAFAGEDSSAKKSAVAALAAKSAGDDSDIIPLLIAKVDDRQASEAVMSVLRARTGLQAGGPGDGSADRPKRPADWQAWYGKWQEQQKTKQALAKVEKEIKKVEAEVSKPDNAPAAPATSGEARVERRQAPDDLGKPVRIYFRQGGTKMYYLISRRVDADGALVSVRVAHTDGGGEETLAADLIARIHEDAP